MKVDVTSIFFNSVIPDATATAPWCVSIGQGKDKKINSDIPGLQNILDGLIYKTISNREFIDLSKGSKNNEYVLISKFDKIYVNGTRVKDIEMIVVLVREHTKSHEGRLRISLPPYAIYNDGVNKFSNEQSYQSIATHLDCGSINGGGCWFVDDISVVNQDELHFSCVVVNKEHNMSYQTSQARSLEWQQIAPETSAIRIGSIDSPQPANDQPLQLIYYGAPGTGKSHTIDKDTDESNSVRTTFHPDSDYAGFVGAYKPTMAPMPINAIVGTTIHHATNSKDEFAFEKKIVYKYVPQAFLKAYVDAWKRYSPTEDTPYYLVIEEINRGNCAQIFGDLFQLLDRNNQGSSSYAICADQDIAQFLRDDEEGFAGLSQEQRDVISNFVLKKDSGAEEHIGASILDGSKLLLPPNMRIWATMNTSDQSLFPIDSAFKRRWNWEYMPIEYNKKDWTFSVGNKRYSWGKFLEFINPQIYELTQSEDKQMGYFFAKPDKKSSEDLQENDLISTKVFVNKVLFYLWTDVFKDYDLTQEPFVYEDDNVRKAYRFTDFFPIENNQKLINFVEGLKLEEVDNNLIDTEFIEETPTDSTTQEKNKKLWATFFDYVKTNDKFKNVFNVNRTPSKDSWMDFTIGLPNVWLNVQQLRTKSKVRISLVVRIKAAVNSIFEIKKDDLESKLSEITGLNVGYKQTSQNNIISFEFENKDFDTISTSNPLFKLIAANLIAAQSVAKEILL